MADRIGGELFHIIALPLKITGRDGSPVVSPPLSVRSHKANAVAIDFTMGYVIVYHPAQDFHRQFSKETTQMTLTQEQLSSFDVRLLDDSLIFFAGRN